MYSHILSLKTFAASTRCMYMPDRDGYGREDSKFAKTVKRERSGEIR